MFLFLDKLIIFALCIYLWEKGGQKHSWMRDVLIPIIIGIHFFVTVNWLVGILTCATCSIIRHGYGAWDPENDDKPSFWAHVTHDRNGWLIRGIVGTIHGLVAPLIVLCYELSAWPFYLAFVFQSGLVNFLVSRLRLNVKWTDRLVGASFGSIVFWFGWIR